MQLDKVLLQAATRAETRAQEQEAKAAEAVRAPAAASDVQMQEDEKRKREMDASSTQPGAEPLEAEVEDFVNRMSPSKRLCAMSRLTQLGVADGGSEAKEPA